ncbi:MAG: flagellar motor stator protein MotA [Myxococcota bacterium]
MKLILGLVVVVASTLGGFVLHHGELMLLVVPTEYLIIGGVLVGSLLVANPFRVVLGAGTGVLREITGGGAPSKKKYVEMLQMIYELLQLARKEGVLALESHVNEPENSSIISKYPSFAKNHHAVTFMTDTLKLFVAGALDAHAMDELMERDLEVMHHEEMGPSHALQGGADALPAIGIVAAVLGIILTMQAIDQGAAAVGEKVAGALVGTFFGVFLSYGFVGPMSAALGATVEAKGRYLQCLRSVLTASIGGVNPPMAVEIGRRSIDPSVRPGFEELEEALKETKGG